MYKNFLNFLLSYTTKTSLVTMVSHAIILVVVTTWLGLVWIAASNFNFFIDVYEKYSNATPIQLERVIQVSQQVNTVIADQRNRLGVDRLYVSKFHNGKVDLNGVHFIYFSRVSESTGPGVSNEIRQNQNLPLSIFPNMLNKLASRECYVVSKVTTGVNNDEFLKSMGVVSMIICPIYNDDTELVGVVGAESVIDVLSTKQLNKLNTGLETLATVLGSLIKPK